MKREDSRGRGRVEGRLRKDPGGWVSPTGNGSDEKTCRVGNALPELVEDGACPPPQIVGAGLAPAYVSTMSMKDLVGWALATGTATGREGKKTMIYRNLFLMVLPFVMLFCLTSPPALAQREYHGADSVFEKDGVAILWGILKGRDEDSSWVYLKMVIAPEEKGRLRLFSVEAVDPFSGEKEWVVRGQRLERENLVKSRRSSFTDKTVRRILFFRSPEALEEGKPDWVVFYRGVPDTTPELLSEPNLEHYFEQALEKLGKR
jgi:hypothetical protein